MSNVLDQWLGDSISAIEMLEREMNEHHQVIQQAMSTIRRHTAAVERLEIHIEVIRGAATQIEGAVEDDRLEQTFEESFSEGYSELTYEDSDAGAAPTSVDEGAGTPVLRVMPDDAPPAAHGQCRLPPPPPSAAARAHR